MPRHDATEYEQNYRHVREPWYQQKWPSSVKLPDRSSWHQTKPPVPADACKHWCQRVLTERMITGERAADPATSTAACADWDHREICCRCRFAQSWFRLNMYDYRFKIWLPDGTLAAEPETATAYGSAYTARHQRGRNSAFIKTWAAHGTVPEVNPCHIGWHAGLRRATFREAAWGQSARLGLDSFGVTAGPSSTSSALCPACRSILPTIPPHLFWEARGWGHTQAVKVSEWEADRWVPGKTKDRVDLTVLNVLEHLPWH